MNAQESKKLDSGQKHILTLINRDKKPDGWTDVSEALYNMLSKNIPKELAQFERPDGSLKGRARLTDFGKNIIAALEWI